MRLTLPLSALSLVVVAACARPTVSVRDATGDGPDAVQVRVVGATPDRVRLSLSRPAYLAVFAPNRSGPPGVVALVVDDSAAGLRSAGRIEVLIPPVARQRYRAARSGSGPSALLVVASDRPLSAEAAAFELTYRANENVAAPFPVVQLLDAREAFVAASSAHGRGPVGSALYSAERTGTRASAQGIGPLGQPVGTTLCGSGSQHGLAAGAAERCGGAAPGQVETPRAVPATAAARHGASSTSR